MSWRCVARIMQHLGSDRTAVMTWPLAVAGMIALATRLPSAQALAAPMPRLLLVLGLGPSDSKRGRLAPRSDLLVAPKGRRMPLRPSSAVKRARLEIQTDES
jgi:hypothetical protein